MSNAERKELLGRCVSANRERIRKALEVFDYVMIEQAAHDILALEEMVQELFTTGAQGG